jgi:uncharacterized tellurite resistance protein B-like protein
MFDRIAKFFDRLDGDEATPAQDELPLAAAALLLEAARTDDTVTDAERTHIIAAVRSHFRLTDAEAATLYEEARAQTRGASHLYDYVRIINDHCPPDHRLWVIEMLWEVAYADGALNDLESNLLRRLGGLLAVSDVERGDARKRVLERLGCTID